jgi:hypothetical protein
MEFAKRKFPFQSLFPAAPIIAIISMAKMQRAALRGPENGLLTRIAATAEGACTVKFVETAPDAGFRVCGANVQFPPAGMPEQASSSICLNPLTGVTLIVNLPDPPRATVRDALLIDNE